MSRCSLSDGRPTLIAVEQPHDDRSEPPPPSSKLFVFCRCGHSEFIHSDRAQRFCLWFECRCSGFALRAEDGAVAAEFKALRQDEDWVPPEPDPEQASLGHSFDREYEDT